jgi:hypothetical protein
MHRHLTLFMAVSLLLVSRFIKFRLYLRTWIAHLRSQPSIAKCKRKNKSRPCPFPDKRLERPLCQAEEEVFPIQY